MCCDAFSVVVKMPVDSTTMVAPAEDHGILVGSRSWKNEIEDDPMRSLPSLASQVPVNRPWVESYLKRYACHQGIRRVGTKKQRRAKTSV